MGDMLAQAVAILYGSQDPEQISQANQWLNTFAQAREAWQVSLDLVGVNNGHSVEAQFFAANLLYNKIRREIHTLGIDEKQNILRLIQAKLEEILNTENGVVKERLALALTLGCVFSGCPEVVMGTATPLLFSGDPGRSKLSLLMLLALAEEADDLDRQKRQPLVQKLNSEANQIFQALDEAIQRHPQTMLHLAGPVSKCTTAWVKLDPTGAGGIILSLGKMLSLFGNLFHFLLGGIVLDSGPDVDEANTLCADAIGTLVEKSPPSDTQFYPQLTRFLLVENSSKLIGRESGLQAVARIGVAIAANYGTFFQSQEGLQLSEFLLQALGHAETRSVKENVLEFFLDLNTIPMQERLPQLRDVLFERLLVQLVRVGSYPNEFTCWEDCLDDDKDSFHRFREQFLADLFETAFGVLGIRYFKGIVSMFDQVSSWQVAEAAIFALRIVAVQVKSKLNYKKETQASSAEESEVHQMLKMVFMHVTQVAKQPPQSIFLSNHLLVESVSRLVGAYAQWFGKFPESPIEQALNYLICGLNLKQPAHMSGAPSHAAHSFKTVCMRCPHRLKGKEIVLGIIAAISESINSNSTLEIAGKKALVEGVSRLITFMKQEDASVAAQQLLHPVMHHLQNTFVASCNGQGEFKLHSELELYASAIRFFEFPNLPNPSLHPTLILLQRSWETFEAVLDKPEVLKAEDNIEAFCNIFTNAIQSAKNALAETVPLILSKVLKIYQAHTHSQCLGVISASVEVFGSNSNLTVCLRDVVHQALSISFAFLQRVNVAEYAELVQAIYDVASKCLIFQPEIILMPNVLSTLMQTGVSTIVLKERDSVRAVNTFLLQLFSLSNQKKTPIWINTRASVMECVNIHGKQLVGNVLIAFGETCPAHLFRSLGTCVFHMRAFAGQLFDQYFVEILQSDDFKKYLLKCNPAIKDEDVHFFIHAVLKQPALPRPKFEALFSDFAKVCRREQMSDLLQMYQ